MKRVRAVFIWLLIASAALFFYANADSPKPEELIEPAAVREFVFYESPPPTSEPRSVVASAIDAPVYETEPPDPEEVTVPTPEINNDTDFEIDAASLLEAAPVFTLEGGAPEILIYHTHGSESYSDVASSDENTRTTDIEKNVVHIGSVVTARLTELGFSVVHVTELHDYPTYSGSYSRSLDTIDAVLDLYPSIKIAIDLHRDAVITSDGRELAVECSVDGESAAQIMFVVGSNYEAFRDNLSTVLKLQSALESAHPGLTRPTHLRVERFNQHTMPGAMLVEIGASGNTLAQAERSGKIFAEILADFLKNSCIK